jgi:hypothetical protein
MNEVPTNDEESAQFIHKLYQEKDEIYDVYARTGSFASLGVKRIDLRVNYYDLYIAIAWIILCTSPIIYYLGALLSNATLFVNLIIIASFFIGNYYFLIIFKIICFLIFINSGSIAINLFISITKTETGSDYGLKSK